MALLAPIFLISSKQWTNVSSPVTIFASYIWLNLVSIEGKCLAVCTRTYVPVFGNLSIFKVSIWQKSFALSKYALKWNEPAICQQLWQYHEMCTCNCFQLFPCVWDFCIPCYMYRSAIFFSDCSRQKFPSLSTKIPY